MLKVEQQSEREKLLGIIEDVEKEFGILALDVISTPEKLEKLLNSLTSDVKHPN